MAIVITVLGITGKIVVFHDLRDFFYSCGPVYVCVATYIIFESLNVPPMKEPLKTVGDIKQILFYDAATTAVTIGSALTIAICIALSLKTAIQTNGLVIGMVVFVYKFGSSVLLSFLVISKFRDLIDEKSSFATRFAATVLLGVFSWLINALINGERVAKKKLEAECAQTESEAY